LWVKIVSVACSRFVSKTTKIYPLRFSWPRFLAIKDPRGTMQSSQIINKPTQINKTMSNNNSFDLAEFESLMALDNPIKSSAATRWERKAARQEQQLDRFIPNRSGMENNNLEASESSGETEHAKLILANQEGKNSRVLAFKNKAPAPVEGYQNSLKVLYSTQTAKKGEVVKPTRHIASAPVRVLDAPDMLDDYCKYMP
jgi:hypothetical protein